MRGIKDTGFTLIELLVTIAIIAALATIAIVTFTSLQKNGRDARRQSDLKVVQSALEQYHADQQYYPNAVSFTTPSKITNGTRDYLKQVPLDPLPSNPQYCYIATTTAGGACTDNCTKYTLYAKLENTPGTAASCGAVPGYNYTVSPP